MKNEHFQGVHPDLVVFVFGTATSQTNQTANFSHVDECIKALIGQTYNPYMLESIETRVVTLPSEPALVTNPDGSVNKVKEIKYSKKYDRWLSCVEVIENN